MKAGDIVDVLLEDNWEGVEPEELMFDMGTGPEMEPVKVHHYYPTYSDAHDIAEISIHCVPKQKIPGATEIVWDVEFEQDGSIKRVEQDRAHWMQHTVKVNPKALHQAKQAVIAKVQQIMQNAKVYSAQKISVSDVYVTNTPRPLWAMAKGRSGRLYLYKTDTAVVQRGTTQILGVDQVSPITGGSFTPGRFISDELAQTAFYSYDSRLEVPSYYDSDFSY